jgi:hypothetical protein
MENAIYLHVQGRVGCFALTMFNMQRVVEWQKPHVSYRDSTFAANIVRGACDAALVHLRLLHQPINFKAL